jgi:sterol desaturase/sphingolipid hydroxylase (fatty acid hydroxylase superfamily)
LWDRLFGTYCDRVTFTERCGFADAAEQRIFDMLIFRDVNDQQNRGDRSAGREASAV